MMNICNTHTNKNKLTNEKSYPIRLEVTYLHSSRALGLHLLRAKLSKDAASIKETECFLVVLIEQFHYL